MRGLFSQLPFIGTLLETRWKDHSNALAETLINVVFSTSPLWLSIIILMVRDSQLGLAAATVSVLQTGELYLYCSATVAPLLYFMYEERKESAGFPSSRMFALVIVVIIMISVVLFALSKYKTITGLREQWNEPFILNISLVLYILSVLIAYLVSTYRSLLSDGAVFISRKDTSDFAREFSSRVRRGSDD